MRAHVGAMERIDGAQVQTPAEASQGLDPHHLVGQVHLQRGGERVQDLVQVPARERVWVRPAHVLVEPAQARHERLSTAASAFWTPRGSSRVG